MALDPGIVGRETPPREHPYTSRDVILYALGIGAKRDELDYLYEGRGPKVYPTFAVVPAFAPVLDLLRDSGANLATLVHGAQTVTTLRPVPPEGTFVTTARVTGVYDMKRLAQVVCSTESRVAGEVVCRTDWQLLLRDEGGFGGPHPPKSAAPRVPEGMSPSFEHAELTSPEQALLYRLSGDTNPLHADPDFAREVGFEQGPILHGLSTYGFIARAIIRHACGGDAAKLRSLSAQFRKPVWPGEAIRTVGYVVDRQVVVKAYAGGRDDAVVTGCFADLG